MESEKLADACAFKPFLHGPLTVIGLDGAVRFDGSFPGFGVALRHKNDTVDSEAQPLGELNLMFQSIGTGVLD